MASVLGCPKDRVETPVYHNKRWKIIEENADLQMEDDQQYALDGSSVDTNQEIITPINEPQYQTAEYDMHDLLFNQYLCSGLRPTEEEYMTFIHRYKNRIWPSHIFKSLCHLPQFKDIEGEALQEALYTEEQDLAICYGTIANREEMLDGIPRIPSLYGKWRAAVQLSESVISEEQILLARQNRSRAAEQLQYCTKRKADEQSSSSTWKKQRKSK